MSQYGREYRLEWQQSNVHDGATNADIQGRFIRVSIFETSNIISDSEIPDVIDLKPAAEPLTIETINNDRDKFQSICSKQATIRFRSNINLNHWIHTYTDRPDNEWLVEIKDINGGAMIFTGFLMLSDMQQTFQPDPNIVELTASDHLGILKDQEWKDLSDNLPLGKYTMAQIVAQCLRKTGLNLPIKIINNLKHGGGELLIASVPFSNATNSFTVNQTNAAFFYPGQPLTISGTVSNNMTTTVVSVINLPLTTNFFIVVSGSITDETATNVTFEDSTTAGHLYDTIYFDALTFEGDEEGNRQDCYNVLEKILAYGDRLFQFKGSWYILRMDELDNNNIYVGNFDTQGAFIEYGSSETFTKSIGRTEVIKFANADTLLQTDRPYKITKLIRNYRQKPICNIDFERGDIEDDSNPLDITYQIDCWTLRRNMPGSYGLPDFTAFIHRIFNDLGYELERYITLTPTASNDTSATSRYIESQAFPIQVNDKFTASIDFRLTHNETGITSTRIMRAVLHGSDDSWWILDYDADGQNPLWRDTANWTLFTGAGDIDVNFETQGWVTQSFEAPKSPVTGDLYIWLSQLNQDGGSFDDHDLQYSNLRFTYIPFINGTYTQYNGHSNSVTRATTPELFNAKLEDEVFLFEMPKPSLKGAAFILSGSVYYLAGNFYSAAQFSLGSPTDASFLHPYGWHQIQALWNQYRNNTRFFSRTVRGLGESWPDLLHKYSLTDNNPNTNNRYFVLLSFGQDWKNQMWDSVIGECYRTDTGRVYTDTFEFKYIRNSST